MEKIQIQLKDRSEIISTDDIIRIELLGKQTQIFTQKGILKSENSLEYFNAKLSEYGFIRINYKHLINIKQISSIKKDKSEIIILDDSTELELGEEYREEFGKLLANKFKSM